ncbi:MAG: hypothetical protein OHK93_003195 [Ramalina farinacea]|uniref:GTP-binding protein 8 n=1 Tax=Ramalina farinacea TaxID=258253 RepID=A0AA43TXZ6_9LECA|nr:hypothetical protein [Ramalina farinacea]
MRRLAKASIFKNPFCGTRRVQCRPQITSHQPARSFTTTPPTLKDDRPLVRQGLSYYWDTHPPNPHQLHQADKFFLTGTPLIIDSAIKFRTVKQLANPEVAFLGRSNVGKSSLLNALMGARVCRTSHNAGRTRSMNFFAVGGADGHGNRGRVTVLDMPGYGYGSRPEWGKEIMKYLEGRKKLKRAFLLIDARHSLQVGDVDILTLFRQLGIPHQIVLSKIDEVLFKRKKVSEERMLKNLHLLDARCKEMRGQIQPGQAEGPEALGEIICTSADAELQGRKMGVQELRWAVLSATGLGTL